MGPGGDICQSCGVPIDDPETRGTDAGGAPNQDYCQKCYRDGALTDPALTSEQAAERAKRQLAHRNLSASQVDQIVRGLPRLRRWVRRSGRASAERRDSTPPENV